MAAQLARRCRRPVDRHPDRPPAAGRVEALARAVAARTRPGRCGATRPRSGPSSCARPSSSGKRTPSAPTSPSTPSPSAWAPRSSWPACRPGATCGTRTATPSCTRPCPTRPTRWAPCWPGCGPCRSPSTRRWRLDLAAVDPGRRGPGPAAVGQHARQPGRRARRPGRGGAVGAGAGRSWCSATSATPSSPGTARPGPSSGTAAGPDGLDGVVAVHSLSKRSNMAGMRVGWYSGDPELVDYLREVRKHAGFMVPGPVQQAAAAALGDVRPRRGPAGALLGAAGPGPGDPGRHRGRRATCRAAGSTCGRRRPAGTAGPGPAGWPSTGACWCRRDRSTGSRSGHGLCPPGHGRAHRAPGPGGPPPRRVAPASLAGGPP